MVSLKNFFTRPFKRKTEVLRLDDEKHYLKTGSTGTQIFSGYFDEEYLAKLKGYTGSELYDEMRRSDAQIRMLLSVVKNPIMSADWSIDAVDDSDEEVFVKEFLEHVLFNDIGAPDRSKLKTWSDFLEEALTCLDFGYSLFEVVHKVVVEHPRFGSYIGLRDLAWRSPKTIEEWNLNRDGSINNVRQVVNGDLEVDVNIDGQHLMPITINKEGDNYEGVSLLRYIYGNWLRKNLYRKLQGIGVEKSALGTPIGKIPTGRDNSNEADEFERVLENYTSHESGYIMLSEGWEIDELKPSFDSEKVQKVIEGENIEMTKSFLANFMELGLSGSGSFALGSDLSDIFLSGIEIYSNKICQAINQKVIPVIIDAKFGKRDIYPKLKATGINDKAGKEFAEVLKVLNEAGFVNSTDTRLKAFAHKKFGLPEYVESVENEQEEIVNLDESEVSASEVQSLVFDKEIFDRQQAENWATSHGFIADKIDDTDFSYRIRQKPPEAFTRFRSKEIANGVTAVIGFTTPEGGGDDDDSEYDLGVQPTTLAESFQVPKTVQANAKRVLEWKKKYGSEVKGMTQVGWTRASQLAKGGPVSFATIKRIAQFKRHQTNAKINPKFKGTPWKDAGYVAWLGWGGDAAILSWAPKIIRQKEKNLHEIKKQNDLQLAEKRSVTKKKVLNSIKENSENLQKLMEENLQKITEDWFADIKKIIEKNSRNQARTKVIKETSPKMNKYKKELEVMLLNVCVDATNQAISETPVPKNKIKLDDIDKLYKSIPVGTRNKLRAELELLTKSQAADLEKTVFFQFNNSIDSVSDADMIIADMQSSVVTITQGARITTTSINIVSDLTNMSRLEIFQAPEVWEEIESYEFVNSNPKSPICQNLAGRVFAKDDPMAKSYLPPLHHNCKSIIIPQYKGVKGNKDINPIGLQPTGTPDQVERIMKSKKF